VDAVAQDFVRRVRERFGERIVRISLFGSRARGVERPWSDHDFLVVVRGDRRAARDDLARIEMDMLLECTADVSPKVVTEEQFRSLAGGPEPFWRNFRRDEVRLWPTTP
jgi:predicted nucleotidyltransferase